MIDVAIALTLAYLMFAGLVSGIHELISALLAQRGKMLLRGIESLCGGPVSRGLAEEILLHPLVDVLRKGCRPPSYVPSDTFALALADVLVRKYAGQRPLFEGLPEVVKRMPEGDLRRSLEILVAQAQGDAQRLQQLLEDHFNKVMDRVSGWYKRHAQWMLLGIGIAVSIVLNVDSINLAQRLARNSDLTAELVAKAKQVVTQGQDQGLPSADRQRLEPQIEEVKKQLAKVNDLNLPIGWSLDENRNLRLPSDFNILLSICGWLISGLAASLGAPFWFDALSKLVSLRTAGIKPQASAEQAPALTTVVQLKAEPGLPAPAATAAGSLNDFESNRLTPVDIEAIQRSLGLPEPQVSAVLDGPTREAIRRWQQTKGLPVSGALDEPSLLALLYPETA